MGQYFYFQNEEGEWNAKPLPSNGACTWFPKLDRYSDEEIANVFEEIIELNPHWVNTAICARGDCGDDIVYTHDKHVLRTTDEQSEYLRAHFAAKRAQEANIS